MNFIFLFLGSLATTFLLIELTKKVFSRFGIVDKPHLYPHESGRAPLPYPLGVVLVGNLCIWLPLILQVLAPGDIKKALYVLGIGVILTVLVAYDDQKRNLTPKTRLAIQILIGAFFGLTAIKIGYITNIFGGVIHLDQMQHFQTDIGEKTIYWIPFFVTIIWYVMIMNAFNWSDNGQGMSSGLACVVFIVLAGLSIKLYLTDSDDASRSNSVFVLAHVAVLIPSCFLYWRYDVARKFIGGDAGTMFLGFMIASLSIVSGGKIATAAVVMGIYLIDAFYVIARRIKNGKNPMKGDFTHLHHRLQKSGVEVKHQRAIVYVLSFLFGVSAIFLETIGKILLFCMIVVIVVYISWIAEKTNDRFASKKK